jgi:NADH-quinone oxidoreductase subunit A
MLAMPTTLALEIIDYLPVVILIMMAATFAFANIVLTLILGPSRTGPVKETTYESGMNPIATARKRFNVRFYIIAMTFLLFDVEIIFLYPWAATFTNTATGSEHSSIFLARVLFFMATTVVAYIYGYRKGVFRFD